VRINGLLLTLHILAVATWIGPALALQVIAARVRPSTPDTVVDELAADAEAVGKMLFAPAAVVLLVTGAALVVRENLGWTDAWILVGIGALVAAGAIGGRVSCSRVLENDDIEAMKSTHRRKRRRGHPPGGP
jgi:uncharacterized membrane protein